MRAIFTFSFAVALLARPAGAVGTRIWQQAEHADFEKGTLKKLSLRSDGRLGLAPVFREVLDSSSAYLWALAEDSKGNLYAGGGGPAGRGASLWLLNPDGKSRVVAELDSLEIHALALDRHDRVYAATSPDGKIYRISPGEKPKLFYDPGAKYIWAMAFNSKGDLFVATGDEGVIYRVTADGNGSAFFQTEETHARSLAVDGHDNLIVGTEPGGLILRISPSAEGFVLYQASKREITAVAVGADGSIYAASVGSKQPVPPPPSVPPAPAVPKPAEPVAQPSLVPQAPTGQPAQRQAAPPPTVSLAPAAVSGGSEVYRIDPDGFPRRVWTHPQDIAYTIGFDPQGRPLIGTGNNGAIYRLDSDLLYTALLKTSPNQVTRFCSGQGGKIYAATGNIGKVYQIGPGLEHEGSLESDVFDAGLFSLWGRLSFRGENHGGAIRFDTRSGNLDRPRKDWSPWQPVGADAAGGRIQSPRARFLQWRLTVIGGAEGRSPEIHSVEVAYLPRNVAPVVEQIEVTPPNYRFPPQSLTLTPSQTITLQPLGRSRKASPPTPVTAAAVAMQYEKGQIGARWTATDDNGDALLHKVEIRGVRESEWKLLKDKLSDKHLSWDSTPFPDGEYLLRVTASDAPDNPLEQALSAGLVSDPFLIDNTPPEILGLSATQAVGKLNVRWKARDALTPVQRAEYSVNGGEWTLVEPSTVISDSREHEYDLLLERVSPGEHTVAVRVTDQYDNQAVEKVVVR